jgi:DNA-binding SARP family transcriptional activator
VAIEYRLLGSLEALEEGRSLTLGASRQRAVLAWLLLHANEVVPVGRLIDELWREDPPETAANILQGYVSDLRKVLGREAIETVGYGYLIRADAFSIDLRRFEALADEGIEALDDDRPREAAEILRRGLDLWYGPALADLLDEPLAAVAVRRLEELRLTALEKRIDADLACSRHGQVVAELASLVEEHPLRERFRAQLMLALYRSGRQADALASYQAGRSILAEELGIDPGPALQSLEQGILEQDRSLDLVDGDEEGLRDLEASRRVVLAVAAGASDPSSVLDLGEALVRKPVFELIVAGLVADSAELASRTSMLNERAGELAQRGVVARAAAFVSDRPGEDVVRLASDRDVVLVLIQAPATLLDKGMPDPDLAHVLAETPCDVAFVVDRDHSSGGPIVVPFGGMDHDWAAIELGAWVARARGVPLQIVGAVGSLESGKRDASRLLFHASVAVQRAVGIPTEPLLADPGVEGMLSASERAGALVVGLSERWQREGLGPVRLALARDASAPVLFVRSGLRPGGLAPRETLTHFTWSVGPIVA